MNEEQELPQASRNPIITPIDERWPLLEMPSRACQIPLTSADEQAIMDMDTLLDALDDEAAGLAAVQIGFPHRIFLLRNGTDEEGNATNNVYVNPIIVAKSRETSKGGEACLSLPGMRASFPRPKSVKLQFFDLDGNVQEETFTGFWARCVMHEMSHLEGRLITHELEDHLARQPKRNKFGMIVNAATRNRITKRRAKKKVAKNSQRANRRK
jgi:peptide deformylase